MFWHVLFVKERGESGKSGGRARLARRIHVFFERPSGVWAWTVQALIFLLILVSLGCAATEYFWPAFFEAHRQAFWVLNAVVLGLFTVEYLLRLFTAPHKWRYALKPLNIVDFMAVFPNYLEFAVDFCCNTTWLRGIRLFRAVRLARVLRLTRLLRILRIFRHGQLFKRIFQYQNTILETITPLLMIFLLIKGVIWALEVNGVWVRDAELGQLFAIIGFALGIILSQKIGVCNDKFIQVEEASIRIYGTLHALSLILRHACTERGDEPCREWARVFLRLLRDPHAGNAEMHAANELLYESVSALEQTPAEMACTHADLCRDAAYCLSKKNRLTPRAYDTLLHQSTVLYLLLIAVFIPGWTGMVSVMLATYILYGMYQLTQDFDSILGGEFELISIDVSELDAFAGAPDNPDAES